jgi:hypothetical protein
MPNGDVDILAGEVDVMQGRAYPQIDGRVLLGKPAQPMHQPFGRKIRRRAHGEHAGVLAAQQSLGAVGDAVERIPHGRQIAAARLGNDEPLPLPIEELEPELGFEGFDLVAHRALGDAKLIRRAREAFMACGGFECLKGIQRRQAAWHCEIIP